MPEENNPTTEEPPDQESDEMKGADYRIRLENYYGPLDLLLYLIKKHEVDVTDISIANIASQYISYLEKIKRLDIDVASEFTVMAATLMRIKSRNLVPDDTPEVDEEDLEDPRKELIQNLIHYRKFKDRARLLGQMRTEHQKHFARPDLTERFRESDETEPEEFELSLWELIRQYSQLREETSLDTNSTIVYDDIPQEIVMDRIMNRVENGKAVSFEELVGEYPTRHKAVSYFLGILELAKMNEIHIDQTEHSSGDIHVQKLDIN